MTDRLERAKSLLRDVHDFPKPGIVFKDITPLLGDGDAFVAVLDDIAARYAPRGVQKILGIEARGFIFGAALAARMGVGFVPARKPKKLPWKTDRAEYALEYGTDAIEIHQQSFAPGARVLLVDDVIATGGTAAAALSLVERQGATAVGAAFVIELGFLQGRAKLPDGLDVYAVMRF